MMKKKLISWLFLLKLLINFYSRARVKERKLKLNKLSTQRFAKTNLMHLRSAKNKIKSKIKFKSD